MEFDAFIAAGLYDPEAPKADERREYLTYLVDRGFTVEQICAVDDRRWPVTDLLAVLTGSPLTFLSAREIAARTGVTPEEVEELRASIGMPIDTLDSDDIAETFIDFISLHKFAVEIFGSERVLGFARVLGAAVAALMEAGREMAWAPLSGAAMTELQVAQANEAAMAAWRVLPESIGHLLMERATRDLWFERDLMQGPVSMGVGFVDLVGSSQWTANVTPQDHAAAINRFEALAVRAASRHGCRIVKFIGDEAMFVGAHALHVAEAAAELCRGIADDGGLPSARGAVGFGPVTPRGGDYFGDVVNTVARATKAATADAIVVTEEVATLLPRDEWTVGAPRRVELRGIAEKLQLFDVRWRNTNGEEERP